MFVRVVSMFALLVSNFSGAAFAGDWTQFRGPGGLGISDDKGVPVRWSSTDNIAWKVELPGPGASSPIIVGQRVFLTCYTGYGLEPAKGDPNELRRHLLCFDRSSGKELWKKTFEPKLPEHKYEGEGSYHGYAASTPISDGERLFIFFGKSGVFCCEPTAPCTASGRSDLDPSCLVPDSALFDWSLDDLADLEMVPKSSRLATHGVASYSVCHEHFSPTSVIRLSIHRECSRST